MNESKDRKDTAWFNTQVVDNDSLSFWKKLKMYWGYIICEVREKQVELEQKELKVSGWDKANAVKREMATRYMERSVQMYGGSNMTKAEIAWEKYKQEYLTDYPELRRAGANLRSMPNDFKNGYECAQLELLDKLAIANEVLEMVYDNTKMPHKHTDPQLRLYCLSERASEAMDKIK